MTTRQIVLGAVEEPLAQQLDGLLPTADIVVYEKHNGAINRLYVFQLITDREAMAARRRLLRRIKLQVTRHRLEASQPTSPQSSPRGRGRRAARGEGNQENKTHE